MVVRLRRGDGDGDVVLLLVDGEVVGAREPPVALGAVERAFAGVFAPMSRQLVGPREPPRAARPVARVRLLAGVLAHVRRQLRRLGVGAAALRERARQQLARRLRRRGRRKSGSRQPRTGGRATSTARRGR